jgi:hypothetical protein
MVKIYRGFARATVFAIQKSGEYVRQIIGDRNGVSCNVINEVEPIEVRFYEE